MGDSPQLFTFTQFAKRHPAFPESSLRWLRFNDRENGFAAAFVNVGRRVLVDEERFFEVIERQNERAAS